MKLYLSHASNFDYQMALYEPLKKAFAGDYDIYFPHDPENEGKHSKDIIVNCDVVVAEVSQPSTGQGIELGWADVANIPIICFHRTDAKPSGALQHITQEMIAYNDNDDMITKLSAALKSRS